MTGHSAAARMGQASASTPASSGRPKANKPAQHRTAIGSASRGPASNAITTKDKATTSNLVAPHSACSPESDDELDLLGSEPIAPVPSRSKQPNHVRASSAKPAETSFPPAPAKQTRHRPPAPVKQTRPPPPAPVEQTRPRPHGSVKQTRPHPPAPVEEPRRRVRKEQYPTIASDDAIARSSPTTLPDERLPIVSGSSGIAASWKAEGWGWKPAAFDLEARISDHKIENDCLFYWFQAVRGLDKDQWVDFRRAGPLFPDLVQCYWSRPDVVPLSQAERNSISHHHAHHLRFVPGFHQASLVSY